MSITKEQVLNYLEDDEKTVDQLGQIIADMVNGDMTPTSLKESIDQDQVVYRYGDFCVTQSGKCFLDFDTRLVTLSDKVVGNLPHHVVKAFDYQDSVVFTLTADIIYNLGAQSGHTLSDNQCHEILGQLRNQNLPVTSVTRQLIDNYIHMVLNNDQQESR